MQPIHNILLDISYNIHGSARLNYPLCLGWKHHSSAQRTGHLALIHPSIQAFPVKHMVTVTQLSDLMASLHAIQADRTFHIHIFIMHYSISFKKVTTLFHRNPLFYQHP
ncbi:hypothetical protein ACB098_01G128300 [Castanea mollissima]